MLGKYVLFGLVTILLFQVSVGGETIIDERGAIDDILKLIQKLQNVIEDAINKGIETLKNTIKKILETAGNAINVAEDTITNLVKKAIEEIKVWQNKALELGYDVTECVEENLKKLNSLPKDTFEDLNSCLSSNSGLINDIFDETVHEIQKFLDLISEKTAEVKECGTGLNAVACYLRIGKDIAILLVQVPLSIAKVVADSVQSIISTGENISLCIADTVTTTTATITSTTFETINCIKQKITDGQKLNNNLINH